MIIPLDPTWFLDCDDKSVTLCERRLISGDGARGKQPKAENIGKERVEQHGFYGSVAHACEGYLKKSPMSGEAIATAAMLIAAWRDAAARVEAACKEIKKRSV